MIRDLLLIFRTPLLLLGLLLILNGGLFIGLVRPSLERVYGHQETLQSLQARTRALHTEERSRGSVLTSRVEIEKYTASFPPRTGLLSLTNRIQTLARQLNLKIPAIDYRPDTKENILTHVTIAMGVEGPYSEIRRFIYELEKLRRTLAIDKLSLRGRPTEGKIQLALELSAYFR